MNKLTIEAFLSHIQLGKPILNKKKKPVNERTAKKYKYYLTFLSKAFNKDFKKLTEHDIDNFRNKLKKDKIRTQKGSPFKSSVKRDIEYKILGSFLKWLGKPELVNFTDNYSEEQEIPALSKVEIEKVAKSCSLKGNLIITLLFDGGFRADELNHVCYTDIKDEDRNGKGYYKIRITTSKTKARTVAVPLCTDLLDQWLSLNKDKVGTGEQLIDMKPDAFRIMIKRAGTRILKKNIYPHLLRHSSVTFYCHILNQYQLCKRYGWSMNSDQPKRYIDREGIEEDGINDKAQEEVTNSYQKEVNQLRESNALLQQKVGSYENDTLEVKEKMGEMTEVLSLISESIDETDKAKRMKNFKKLQKIMSKS